MLEQENKLQRGRESAAVVCEPIARNSNAPRCIVFVGFMGFVLLYHATWPSTRFEGVLCTGHGLTSCERAGRGRGLCMPHLPAHLFPRRCCQPPRLRMKISVTYFTTHAHGVGRPAGHACMFIPRAVLSPLNVFDAHLLRHAMSHACGVAALWRVAASTARQGRVA